jgi:gliding motility-associated-like protein
METEVDSTTGDLKYSLIMDGYNEPNVQNEQLTGNYTIEDLDQMSVINTGDSIENLNYHFTPVIMDAKGPGGHCWGDPKPDIIVQVAPELKGNLVADEYIGGWEIRCHGLLSDSLHSNVRGGYYILPYTFDWETAGGTAGNLVGGDSVQAGLGVGQYWFDVVDRIGCIFYSDSIFIEQPDTIMVEDSITDATCAHLQRDDGAIDIEVSGGTTGYAYYWDGPFTYESTQEDVLNGIAGRYLLTVTDTNHCTYDDVYFIESARDIQITPDPSDYRGFGIQCNGDSNGYIDLTVAGGFPGYSIVAYDQEADDSIHAGTILIENGGLRIENLDAGTYVLLAFDDEQCYNQYPPEIVLTEPDSVTILRVDPKPVYDTVDISCYGADDGIIDILVSGGRTDTLPNTFLWTGPPGETDLVPDDSIQSSLGPGTYHVRVTDVEGCWGEAAFTLIEPTKMTMQADSIFKLNTWNISCYGYNDGYIGISSDGGIPGHTYGWRTEQMTLADSTLQDQGGLVAGTYMVTITDSIGCTLDTFFTLRQPNPLDVDYMIPEYNTYAIACHGDTTGEIHLVPYGGADSTLNTYLWSSSDGAGWEPGSMDQAGITAGTYTLEVTDINGCDSTWIFNLEHPTPIMVDSISADSAKCANTATGFVYLAVSGGVPGYSYLWNSGETTEDLEWIYAGEYEVTITDQNGCGKDTSIEVFEADYFSVMLLIDTLYNGTPVSCADSSDAAILLVPKGGTAPYEYLWNTGATTKDLVDIPAGTYSVLVRDYYDCLDSAEVVITEPSPIEYSMQIQDPLCYKDANGKIELLVTGGTVINLSDYDVWLNGVDTGPYIEDLPEGLYLIRIEDLNDCYVETEAELIHPDSLALSFETGNAFCRDKPDGAIRLDIDGGTYPYHIGWDRGLPDNENDFNDLYWGEYVATVTDANNCVTIDTAFVGYTYTSCLSIPNAFSPNSDGFNDLWIIEGLELYHNVKLRIFDRWGTRVYYSGNAADEPWDGSFNGRELPIDSYHYIIDLNNDEPAVTGNVTIVK